MVKKIVTMISAVVAGGALMVGNAEAQSTSVTCAVTRVAWATGSSGTVQVYCGGNWYYGFGSHSSCPVANADSRKAWFALGQSALLSTKNLYMEYTTCGTNSDRALTYTQLRN